MKIRKEPKSARYPFRQWWIVGGLSLIVLILYRQTGFFGHFGYDDMWYAWLAAEVADGHFQLGADHYGYRWAFIYPLALIYYIAGISDWSSAIWPLLIHLATIYIIYRINRQAGSWAIAFSLLFFLFNPDNLFYADKIMPDGLLAFSILLGLAAIYKVYTAHVRQHHLLALLLTFALALGILTKLSLWLVVPVYFGWFLFDMISRQRFRFWRWSILSFLTFSLLYMIVLWVITGDPLARINAIYSNQYTHECRYDLLPVRALLDRICKELWLVWLKSGLLGPIVLAFLGLLFNRKKDNDPVFRFWAISGLGLAACANFMSISFTNYVPLCPDPRHFLFITPPLAIAMGRFYMLATRQSSMARVSMILLFILALLSIVLAQTATVLTYAGLALSFLPLLFFGKKYAHRPLLLGAFILATTALALFPLRAIKYARQVDYHGQKTAVHSFLKTPRNTPVLVLSNEVQCNIGRYWMGFDSSKVVFRPYGERIPTQVQTVDSCYVMANGMMRYLSGLSWDDLPQYIREKPVGHDTIVFQPPVFLYTISTDELKK